MAVGLRSALLAATSISVLACTTSDRGFTDAMSGVGTTGGDLRLDALPTRAEVADALPADAPALDRPPDVPGDVPVDIAPDLGRDQMPDLPADTRPPTNLANGSACGAASWCQTGFCVDGVCCDRVCNNGCVACRRTRTSLADGTCGTAIDLEGRPCGSACGVVDSAVPAVVQKVCMAGVCGFPPALVALERCASDNACLTVFCDNATARCVSAGCAIGSCCCNSPDGTRACVRQDMCVAGRICSP
jgi:hypothetical protein